MATQAGINPLTGPSIAWTAFLKDAVSLTGHSPTRVLDASGLELKAYPKFLAALGEFQGKFQDSDGLLDHLSFGFLIWGPASLTWNMLERTALKITSTKIKGGRAAVVSGTLKEWKYAVINCLQPSNTKDLRWVFNEIFNIFYRAGLGNIWEQKPDGLLEYSE